MIAQTNPPAAATAPEKRRTITREEYELYQPLVRRIAMKAARKVPRHISVNDLISYGWVGFMEALSRADVNMPREEFEAYASYRVRGAILDHLRSLDPASRETRSQSRKIARTMSKLQKSLGRAPEEDEIVVDLGTTTEAYRSSLDAIARAGMARLEMIDLDSTEVASSSELQDSQVQRMALSEAVAKGIEQLPERLRHVLALYYQEECTLREIGAVLGVSESRVCQLHTEAVHRLRALVGME